MSNKYYIEKYKDFDDIIKTYYKAEDVNGKIVDIKGIVNPLKIDNRQQCSVTDQQGNTPHCAAYSICNICEALIWKKTGKLINLNADQVYAKAKTLDGAVNDEGTYLEYAIQAALQLGGFNGSKIKVNTAYNDRTDKTVELLKFLIHKYDFLHAGFMISEGWYGASSKNPYAIAKGSSLGGHAVIICGYDQTGVYIQNSWGQEWGSMGFAIVPWNDVKSTLMYVAYLDGSLDI